MYANKYKGGENVLGYYDQEGRLVLLGDEENEEVLDEIFGFDDDEEEDEE